jgi:hypothetical protein
VSFFALPTQYGAFQHTLDYSLVTEDNPAHPGETIAAYLTGLPTTMNPPPDGYPAPASPLSPEVLCDSYPIDWLGLRLGSASLFDSYLPCSDSTGMRPIPFIGLSPGSVGLYQINFTLPPATPSGDQPLQLEWDVCQRVPLLFDCVDGQGEHVYLSQTVLLPAR